MGGAKPEDIKTVGKKADPDSLPSALEVNLDRLTPEVPIRKNSRNLFNYSRSPDEVAEEVRQRNEAERLAAEAAKRRQEQEAADALRRAEAAKTAALLPPPPPPPPLINFKFIGKMGQPRDPIAILADGSSGEIFTVREGEVLLDKFKIRKIEYDAVTIGYVKADWTETKTIKMGS